MMKYKGYTAKVEFDDEAMILHGEVADTRDVITFQAESAAEIEKAFHDSVDVYLKFCASENIEPDRPYSGQLLVRITPDMHRDISRAARLAGSSLNAWISSALQGALQPATAGPDARDAAVKMHLALTNITSYLTWNLDSWLTAPPVGLSAPLAQMHKSSVFDVNLTRRQVGFEPDEEQSRPTAGRLISFPKTGSDPR